MSAALFWALAALMLAAVAAALLPPLLRRRAAPGASQDDPNLTLLREQRAQLAADRQDGLLDAAQYRQAETELARRALDETGPGLARPAGPPAAPDRITAWALSLALPLLALAVYLHLGDPASLARAPAPAPTATAAPTAPDIEAMVTRLAQRLQDLPDDGPGWQMLARSYTALGRFGEASQAYARAARLTPNDAQLLADQADALAMAQGRSAAGEPTRLVERALTLDPDNLKALAIAGNAALERGDPAAAQAYFQRAERLLPAKQP